MLRIFRSLILGLALGALVGLYFGWVSFPMDARNRQLSQLAQSHQDDYSVMIAAGYAADGDLAGASARLALVYGADAARQLRESAERIISSSARSLPDIRLLVALARDLGQLSPLMMPFLTLEESGG